MSVLSTLFTTLLTPAYIGPGSGLSAIGSILALIGIVLLLVIGFVWYPLKKYRQRKAQENQTAADKSSDESTGLP